MSEQNQAETNGEAVDKDLVLTSFLGVDLHNSPMILAITTASAVAGQLTARLEEYSGSVEIFLNNPNLIELFYSNDPAREKGFRIRYTIKEWNEDLEGYGFQSLANAIFNSLVAMIEEKDDDEHQF